MDNQQKALNPIKNNGYFEEKDEQEWMNASLGKPRRGEIIESNALGDRR